MSRLWIVAMIGGTILSCQPKTKSPVSLEKGVEEANHGSLKVSTEASMRLADLFGMANHHFLPLDRVSGLRYHVTGSRDYIKGIEAALAKRSYVGVLRKEARSTDSSTVTLFFSFTLLDMTEANQRDWLKLVQQWQMVEETSEKVFQSRVTEGQEINYLKRVAQNPFIKWEEQRDHIASEDDSYHGFFFSKEKSSSIR